jgi:hypothetical protein
MARCVSGMCRNGSSKSRWTSISPQVDRVVIKSWFIFIDWYHINRDSKYTSLVLQALYFDLRKGAHSIGSNVRDAAAYVLWALARTQNSNALVPHAEKLAQRLMAVALFDREVHIRRAASAAFQEHVGRTVGMNLSSLGFLRSSCSASHATFLS